MIKHSQEFINAAEEASIFITKLNLQSAISITERVVNTFCNDEYKYPIWDNLQTWIGVTFPHAWLWFDKLLLKKEVIIFFEPTEYDLAFAIKDGADLPMILENAYRFSFYVTDKNISFLLCYNDHNNLIATGEASNWLSNYVAANHNSMDIYSKAGLI